MTTAASDPQIVPRPPASLPAEPLTVARYLAARASIATLRLATSAVAKAHEWAGRESPCREPGRASLKGDDRRELPLEGSLHSTAALAPSLDRPAVD